MIAAVGFLLRQPDVLHQDAGQAVCLVQTSNVGTVFPGGFDFPCYEVAAESTILGDPLLQVCEYAVTLGDSTFEKLNRVCHDLAPRPPVNGRLAIRGW